MDPRQQALRAALQRALTQQRNDTADSQRSVRTLRVALNAADAAQWNGDVVALMDPAPSESYDALWRGGIPVLRLLPVAAASGVAFGYPQVREHATALLNAVASAHPAATRLALPLPGVAQGLDEGACLENLLLGLADGLAADTHGSALRELVLLEPNARRRATLAAKLAEMLGADAPPPGWVARPQSWPLVVFAAAPGTPRPAAPFEQRLTYQDTLTAFVAMPFKPEMRDIFHYGIQGPAQRSGFKAERLDFEHFTGSVVDQIKERIQRAHLVIADMTGANANVFLEIGFAWGKGRPTLLLWHTPHGTTPAQPPFDVAADSRLDYVDIGELDKALTAKLQALHPTLRQRALGPE